MSIPPAPPSGPDEAAVRAVRHFNRFYTRRAGVLAPYLGGDLSLTEVRVLYELAQQPAWVAAELGRLLELDGGYLSRILKKFERQGWLARAPHPDDARQHRLTLTPAGQAAFAPMEQASRDEVAALLEPLAGPDRQALLTSMARIEQLLAPGSASTASARPRTALLRDPAPGDLGWLVQQHGEIYAREYGFDTSFEGLVAGIVAEFVRQFDPAHEKAWIAELDGERVGAVVLVRKSATVAQLRLLLLTPAARGLGLGGRLTDECLAFARAKGYREVVLWTQSFLTAARAIYAARGFVCVDSTPTEAFGQSMVSETWSLTL